MTNKQLLQQILEGQADLKQDLFRLEKNLMQIEIRLTNRIDKIGMQLAYLEDDTPTNEEFRALDKRVGVLEKKLPT